MQHERAWRPLAGLLRRQKCDAVVHALHQGRGRALPAHERCCNPPRSIGGASTASSSRTCWQLLVKQGGAHHPQMDDTQGALPACFVGTLRGSEHLRIGAIRCCLPLDKRSPTIGELAYGCQQMLSLAHSLCCC